MMNVPVAYDLSALVQLSYSAPAFKAQEISFASLEELNWENILVKKKALT